MGVEVEVCVVFTVRERYAHAPKALEALFANTQVPFRLLIVDAATPKRYLRRIEAAARGRPRVEFIAHDGYLLPNRARNLAIASVREPFVFFVENDCEIRPGCLERLLAVSREHSAVAVPWMWEDGRRHFDVRAGRVTELGEGEISIDPAPGWDAPPETLEKLEFFENHCFLMPHGAVEAIGPLDDELNTRELIDLSLAVRRARVPAFLVPGAEVDFFPPPPIRWDELTHYRVRWDLKRVQASNERVRKRWRISNMPRSGQFAWRQHLRVSRLAWGALRLRLELGRWWRILRRRALLLALLAVPAGFGRAPAMTMVQDGRPRAVIILPEKPSPAAREGARVLKEHVLQITGADLPIESEAAISSGPSAMRGWVLVGEGLLSEERGFSAKVLGPGGMLLEARGDVLALLGPDLRTPSDPDGTLHAVTTFLEEKLGVRYLWPGESGKVVPKTRTIAVDDFRRAATPVLAQRLIRDGRYGRSVRTGLGRLGFTEGESRRREAEAVKTRSASPDWFRWHKLGGSLRLATGHAFGRLWEKHGKAHPDWFALQPNGSRDQSREPGRARLCVSNPGLIEAVAAEKIAELDAHPELLGVSIAPNDGGHLSFCSCPSCEALDAPNAPEVALTDYSAWKKRKYKHVALTDRKVHFWNAVAEKVAAARPGKLLVVDAYSAYSTPPALRKLHPNLVVRFVPMNYLNEESRRRALQSWERWSRAAGRIFFRPNLLLAGRSGAAYVFPRRFAEDFRSMARRGMMGTDFDSGLHHWSTQGLNYYVVARLNWDPEADAGAIVDDYCRAGFGPAAGAVRGYFDRLEALTDEAAAKGLKHLEPFHPGAIAELNDMLMKARSLAAGDPEIEGRIAFLKAGLRWTEVDARAHDLIREPGSSAAASEKKRILDERDAVMRDIFQNDFLAVNVASVSGNEDGLWKRFLPTWKKIRSRLP